MHTADVERDLLHKKKLGIMLELSQCSCLFLASFALFSVGVSVLGTSLGTLAFTSSFDRVFPFGTPLWISALVSDFARIGKEEWVFRVAIDSGDVLHCCGFIVVFLHAVCGSWWLHVRHLSAFHPPARFKSHAGSLVR